VNYEKLKELPEWVREVHSACERLNEAALSVPAENYRAVATLRDSAEALWLSYVGKPSIVASLPPSAPGGTP
jgi:hypothetical protein